MVFWASLGLFLLVGVSLGLLGGGGSILTVPILTYVLGWPAQEAIAASLFIVGVTSLSGMLSHARAGRVKWRVGVIFGAASMGGAFIGGLIGGQVPGVVLMVLFSAMMLAAAMAMIRGRQSQPEVPETGATCQPGPDIEGAGAVVTLADAPAGSALSSARTGVEAKSARSASLPLPRIMLDGAAVGVATGLVGAGGGFLVVPALVLLGGLPMSAAVGTSLLVIAMKSGAGLAGYLLSVHIDWAVVVAFAAVAIGGSVMGARLSGRVSEAQLRRGFGYFVLVMGALVMVQELPGLIDLVNP